MRYFIIQALSVLLDTNEDVCVNFAVQYIPNNCDIPQADTVRLDIMFTNLLILQSNYHRQTMLNEIIKKNAI